MPDGGDALALITLGSKARRLVSISFHRGVPNVNSREMQIESQPYASQAPEDRNAMTDVEVTAASITASVYQEATTSSSTSSSSAAAAGRSAAAMRITQMEAGMELKLDAFVQWAGPMVLAALGISPSG